MGLNPKNFGLAFGVLWGISVFLMTIANMFTGYASLFIALLADVYPGFGPGLAGSFIGLVYGFLDGFIGFFIFAWLYNKFNG